MTPRMAGKPRSCCTTSYNVASDDGRVRRGERGPSRMATMRAASHPPEASPIQEISAHCRRARFIEGGRGVLKRYSCMVEQFLIKRRETSNNATPTPGRNVREVDSATRRECF
eukprot:4304131-Prymnesium_polylepis.2